MAVAQPGQPSRDTGLPPGVEVGSVGRRVAAYLIEALVPAIVAGVLGALLPGASGSLRAVLSIVGALLVVGWGLLLWYLLAERAAGPGMRLMRIQLVGFYDGRPVGWVRVLLRGLIFAGLSATGIGLLVMLVFLVLHPRKQGWHDLAVKAVVIKERILPPPGTRPAVAQHVAVTPEPAPSMSAPPPPSYAPVAGYGSAPPAPAQAPYRPAPGGPAPGGPGSAGPAPGGPPGGPPPGYGPAGPPSAPEPMAPLVPPTGLGHPPRNEQPYAVPPPGPERPAPPPPSHRGSHAATFGDTRPMPATGPPPPRADWHAVLDDGRRLVIDHLVLLGRNPQPAPGEEDAELVKVADETRTVSKLHLAVGVDAAGLYVVDRGSTNGSTVTTPDGATRRCVPGETVYVAPGSIVSMGDHWLEVRHGDGAAGR